MLIKTIVLIAWGPWYKVNLKQCRICLSAVGLLVGLHRSVRVRGVR